MKNCIASFFIFSTTLVPAQSLAIDYGNEENWAVINGKTSREMEKVIVCPCSDSVDVFYVYPTLFLDKNDVRWIKELSDTAFRNKILETAVKYQASAWASAGKLFVPFYRQAHIRSYRKLDEGGRDSLLFAYSDVKAAFLYYLEHYNKGRGIILAGHSQGSTHISLLLKEFFDGKDLQKQLVAAYIPGIGFDSSEFGTVKLMTNPMETGGFVTWNTHKRKTDPNTIHWHLGKAVINPVTWDTTEFTNRSKHKGFLYSNDKLYKRSVSVHMADGYIWVDRPRFPYGYLASTMANYHIADVNFFWEDIRQNAILRTATYLRNASSN